MMSWLSGTGFQDMGGTGRSSIPARKQRVVVAAVITLLVCIRFYATHLQYGETQSDFSPIWFGAKALLHGANPYGLIGPGLVFDSRLPVLYPSTAFALAIPFSLLSELWASLAFIALSTFLLAYGITRDGWHRLPLFASVSFVTSAQLAQWSTLMTAALFIPSLAVVIAAKPQAGLPIVAASRSTTAIKAAIIGGIALIVVSLVLFPRWPLEWLGHVRATEQLRSPLTRLGGVAILFAALRWRRPEAWLVLSMAALPQTWYSYNVLPLLTVGNTFRESGLLAIISSAGSIATAFLVTDLYSARTAQVGGTMLVATAYLPAVLLVLRRPNEGPVTAWMNYLSRVFRRSPERSPL